MRNPALVLVDANNRMYSRWVPRFGGVRMTNHNEFTMPLQPNEVELYRENATAFVEAVGFVKPHPGGDCA